MTKSVLVFSILVLFVAATVWFVIQKTRETKKVTEEILSLIITLTPTPTPTPATGKPIRYDNGLVVQDLVVGSGKIAANGDTLNAHYVGILEDGTKFDSSYDRGQPLQFVLGAGQLIKGWELGLIGMKEGGKRKLIIPSALGYGSKGAGDIIPPNATLVFEIELVSVVRN